MSATIAFSYPRSCAWNCVMAPAMASAISLFNRATKAAPPSDAAIFNSPLVERVASLSIIGERGRGSITRHPGPTILSTPHSPGSEPRSGTGESEPGHRPLALAAVCSFTRSPAGRAGLGSTFSRLRGPVPSRGRAPFGNCKVHLLSAIALTVAGGVRNWRNSASAEFRSLGKEF